MHSTANTTHQGDGDVSNHPSLDFNDRDHSQMLNSMARADIVVAIVLTTFLFLLLLAFLLARRCHRRQGKVSHRKNISQDLEGKKINISVDHIGPQTRCEKLDKLELELPTIVVTSQTSFNDSEGSHEDASNAIKSAVEAAGDTLEGSGADPSNVLAQVASIAKDLQRVPSADSLDMDIKSVGSKRTSVFIDSWADIQAHCAESFELQFTSTSDDNLDQVTMEYDGSTTSIFDEGPTVEVEDSFPLTPNDTVVVQEGLTTSTSTPPFESFLLSKICPSTSTEDEEEVDKVDVGIDAQPLTRKTRSAVRDMPSFLSYSDIDSLNQVCTSVAFLAKNLMTHILISTAVCTCQNSNISTSPRSASTRTPLPLRLRSSELAPREHGQVRRQRLGTKVYQLL